MIAEKMITSWQRWKSIFHPLVNAGDLIGISDETMSDIARRVSELLNEYIDPLSPEQRAFKDLWDIAGKEEKQVLSRLLIRGLKQG